MDMVVMSRSARIRKHKQSKQATNGSSDTRKSIMANRKSTEGDIQEATGFAAMVSQFF